MAEPVWYCIIDGQTIGPISRQQIADLAAGGKLRRNDYVWQEGMLDWLPATQVPEIFGDPRPPAAPPTQPGPVVLDYAPARGFVYAGFWLRFVAILVDGLVFIGISIVLGIVGALLVSGRQERNTFVELVRIVVWWLYFALMESSPRQGTFGKLALGLKVTDLNGDGPISFGRATGRHFAKILSMILLIGYVMAGFTARKQALHDLIAGCLVLRRR